MYPSINGDLIMSQAKAHLSTLNSDLTMGNDFSSGGYKQQSTVTPSFYMCLEP